VLKWKVDIWQELTNAGYGFANLKKSGEISQYTLVRLHNGETNVSFNTLDSICRLLNRQPGELLEYVKEP